jgi:hypothetical protein
MELEVSLLYVARIQKPARNRFANGKWIRNELKQKPSTLQGAIHAGTSKLTDTSALACLKTIAFG